VNATDIPSPFDAPTEFLVLGNARGDRSLWPAWRDVPPGWTVLHGPAPRDSCTPHL